jgi:MFS family permease
MKCAVQTPVGYRCKECVRAQQGVYFNAQSWDNPIAFAVGLLVTLVATPIASAILGFTGFLGIIVAFAIGASAGGILAQTIRWAVSRRRGRYLGYFAVAGIVFGVVLGSVISLLLIGRFPLFSLPTIILAFLAVTTAYRILR